MVTKETVLQWINEKLTDSQLVIIELIVSKGKIQVFLEHPEHVSVSQCALVSKALAKKLEESNEDYEIEVSSPGIDKPFKHMVQYKKYVGKDVDVTLADGNLISGRLLGVNEENILVNKLTKLKNKKEETDISIPFSQIKETKLNLKF